MGTWDNTYKKKRSPFAKPEEWDSKAPVSSVSLQAAASKREAFLWIVQTGLLSHSQRRSILSRNENDGDVFDAMLVANQMAGAVTVSSRIPDDMSAFDAAHDFLMSVLSEYQTERKDEWYEHPEWTGLATDEERRRNAVAEMRLGAASDEDPATPIRANWKAVGRAKRGTAYQTKTSAPAPAAVPAVGLQQSQPARPILATPSAQPAQQLVDYLQAHGCGKMADFAAFLPDISYYAVSRLLRKLEEAKAVHSIGYSWFPGPVPSDTDQKKRKPRQGLRDRRTGPRPARETPDGRRILRALRACRSETLDGLWVVAPQLDHGSLLRLLGQLEEDGWVAQTGDTWRATINWQSVRLKENGESRRIGATDPAARLEADDLDAGDRDEPRKGAGPAANTPPPARIGRPPKRRIVETPIAFEDKWNTAKPGDAQKIHTYLQTYGQGRVSDFVALLPHISDYVIGRLLRNMEQAGSVHSIGYTWHFGRILPGVDQRKRRPKGSAKATNMQQVEAHEHPDGRRIIRALKILRTEELSILEKVVPKLDRHGVLNILTRLQDTGWVENSRGGVQGEWSATEKLKQWRSQG